MALIHFAIIDAQKSVTKYELARTPQEAALLRKTNEGLGFTVLECGTIQPSGNFWKIQSFANRAK
jgi:hypothetical protein